MLTTGCTSAAHGRCSRIRQVAPMCTLTCFLWPTRVHIANGISIASAVFLHSSPQRVPIVYNGLPLPLKIAHSHGGFGPHLIRGPTRVHNPNDISIGSEVFAGLTTVTDRPTDRHMQSLDHAPPSVTVCRIYVRSTAMRPKMK